MHCREGKAANIPSRLLPHLTDSELLIELRQEQTLTLTNHMVVPRVTQDTLGPTGAVELRTRWTVRDSPSRTGGPTGSPLSRAVLAQAATTAGPAGAKVRQDPGGQLRSQEGTGVAAASRTQLLARIPFPGHAPLSPPHEPPLQVPSCTPCLA